jgi:hypothetical protein
MNSQQSSSSTLLPVLNALLAELYRTLSFYLPPELNRVPQHSMHLLNALLAELYRTPQRFCLLLCPPLHSLTSKVFNNLEVFLLSQ